MQALFSMPPLRSSALPKVPPPLALLVVGACLALAARTERRWGLVGAAPAALPAALPTHPSPLAAAACRGVGTGGAQLGASRVDCPWARQASSKSQGDPLHPTHTPHRPSPCPSRPTPPPLLPLPTRPLLRPHPPPLLPLPTPPLLRPHPWPLQLPACRWRHAGGALAHSANRGSSLPTLWAANDAPRLRWGIVDGGTAGLGSSTAQQPMRAAHAQRTGTDRRQPAPPRVPRPARPPGGRPACSLSRCSVSCSSSSADTRVMPWHVSASASRRRHASSARVFKGVVGQACWERGDGGSLQRRGGMAPPVQEPGHRQHMCTWCDQAML